MEDQKPQTVAAQTEVPVNNLHPTDKHAIKPKTDKKIIIACVVALIVIIALASYLILRSKPGNSSAIVQKITTDAKVPYQKGNYNEAAAIFKAGLRVDKDSPELQAGVIEMNSLEGNQNGKEVDSLINSKPYIDQALKTNPNNTAILVSIGYAYETAGDYNKAIEYYDKALVINPNLVNAVFGKAHSLQFLGNIDEANSGYDKAYKLDSNNPQVIMAQANIQATKGKNNDAFNLFKKAADSALSNNQTKSDALTAASKIARTSGNYKVALDLSKQAVDLGPNFSPALGNYGYNLAITGNPQAGETYLRRSIEANPRITQNYNDLAEVLRAQGKFADAVKIQKDLSQKVDNDNTLVGNQIINNRKSFYLYNLAKTYDMADQPNSILPLLTQAVTIDPKLKSVLKQDMDRGIFFKQFYLNNEFTNLTS